MRLRWQFHFEKETVEVEDTVRLVNAADTRQFVRVLRLTGSKAVTVTTDLPVAKTPASGRTRR